MTNQLEKALAEAALNKMQENAKELGLTYCKHGSDRACKECYMEQELKRKNYFNETKREDNHG